MPNGDFAVNVMPPCPAFLIANQKGTAPPL
jgi:hypothetical protein